MLVRARDPIYRMKDLKGKKIGLSKSLNVIKNDWWRCQEHQGIELMLRVNGMTVDDEGCLWLALGRSGQVRRYLPDATLDAVVALRWLTV